MAADESEVSALYRGLLDSWNRRNAHDFAALFQNTPAQFHGRPELAQQLTAELQQLLS